MGLDFNAKIAYSQLGADVRCTMRQFVIPLRQKLLASAFAEPLLAQVREFLTLISAEPIEQLSSFAACAACP